MKSQPPYATGSVTSMDGTSITFRRPGSGPGIILGFDHMAPDNGGKPGEVAAVPRRFFS